MKEIAFIKIGELSLTTKLCSKLYSIWDENKANTLM